MTRKMRTHRKLKVAWIDLVDPSCGNGFWNVPLAQAFEVYRWLIATAHEYREHGRSSPYELLYRHPSCINTGPEFQDGIGGTGWLDQLRRSLSLAILGGRGDPAVESWRADHGIDVGGESVLPVRHITLKQGHVPGHARIHLLLADLLPLTGRLNKQPVNAHYKRARNVRQGLLTTSPAGHRLYLRYGYARGCGEWSYELALQEPDELFDAFVARAWDAAVELVEPAHGWLATPWDTNPSGGPSE